MPKTLMIRDSAAVSLLIWLSVFFTVTACAGVVDARCEPPDYGRRVALADLLKGTMVSVYLRGSSDSQVFSVSGQRTVVRALVEKQGWEVVEEYVDEGESGATTENRHDLQRLLRDAAFRRFDLVVMYDVSRISRAGVIGFWSLAGQLWEHGVQLYCCTRQMVVNEKNAFLFTVDASQAREENVKRSRDAARGMHQSIFLRDRDPGRRPPFALDQMRVEIATGKEIERVRYMRDGSKKIMTPDGSKVIRTIPKKAKYPKDSSLKTVLVPGDPDDVDVLQRIFRDTRTLGLQRLVDGLIKDGLRSPTGKQWRKSSVRSILKNKAYLGFRVTNQVSRARYYFYGREGVVPKDEAKQGREHFVKRPEAEWNVVPGTHEALVDAETFGEAQGARERRRDEKMVNRKGVNQKREYFLSAGFGKCDRCGGVINGTIKKAKNRQYPQYYCSTNQNVSPMACAGYHIPMDALDEFVLNEVRVSVTATECLTALTEGLEAEYTRELALYKPLGVDEAAALKAEQERIAAARREIVESVKGDPAMAKFMKPEIERLVAEDEALKRKLQQAKPAIDKTAIKTMVERGMKFFKERVLGPMGALASNEAVAVERVSEAVASGEKADAAPNGPDGRPCVPELREMLRVLDVRFTYDPDRKEGTLKFDPFAQYAAG